MFEHKWVVLIAMLTSALVLSGCASSREPKQLMGNTNWLTVCDDDDDCGDDLACKCGICTRECEDASDCAELDGVCDSSSDALVAACGGARTASLCLPECSDDGDCGDDQQCVDARCLPSETVMSSMPDGGNGSICGVREAFVTQNLAPDSQCIIEASEAATVLPSGLYDIASANYAGSTRPCPGSYRVALLVNSCLTGADNILQIHSAEVRLKLREGGTNDPTIRFDRNGNVLPNPFRVDSNSSIFPVSEAEQPSSSVAFVEAIPNAYAEQLDDFTGQQLLAEITMFGTTTGDRDIELPTFVYPIDICDSCLMACQSSFPGLSSEEIHGDSCPDNAAADGRICVDPDC